MRFAVDVVAVVPHDDRAEVGDGGEYRVAGTDDDACSPGARAQEFPVAALGAGIGAQQRHLGLTENRQ